MAGGDEVVGGAGPYVEPGGAAAGVAPDRLAALEVWLQGTGGALEGEGVGLRARASAQFGHFGGGHPLVHRDQDGAGRRVDAPGRSGDVGGEDGVARRRELGGAERLRLGLRRLGACQPQCGRQGEYGQGGHGPPEAWGGASEGVGALGAHVFLPRGVENRVGPTAQ